MLKWKIVRYACNHLGGVSGATVESANAEAARIARTGAKCPLHCAEKESKP